MVSEVMLPGGTGRWLGSSLAVVYVAQITYGLIDVLLFHRNFLYSLIHRQFPF